MVDGFRVVTIKDSAYFCLVALVSTLSRLEGWDCLADALV